ncbi:MAG: AhpC/TSA family protein [Clostridiales bacterium]|nr:AhpC/TSA family protein [Clostridiales bacterium]
MGLLEELNKEKMKYPRVVIKYFSVFTEKLIKSGIVERALKVGDKVPNIVLKNELNEDVSIYDLLKWGPIILKFYRGSWCPYCNLELSFYADYVEKFKEYSYSLVAVSPELPDDSMSFSKRKSLSFTILSDTNNILAKKMKLVYKLSLGLRILYRLGGINLKNSQGNNNHELPIPATFLINQEGIIEFAHYDVDYTVRLDPEELLNNIKELN